MIEQWRPVKGYEGFYEVSDKGRVKRLARVDTNNHPWPEKILNAYVNKRGYVRVHISCNGKTKTPFVHRLVAEAFIPRPDGMDIINHLDCNPANNCAENLEWTTYKGNMEYASSLGRMKYKPSNLRAAQESRKVPVVAISSDGKRRRFDSQREAANVLGISPGHIAAACRKEYGYKTVGGYMFEYADKNRQAAQKPLKIGRTKEELAEETRKRMIGNTYGVGKIVTEQERRHLSEVLGKPVFQFTKDGVFVAEFPSGKSAQEALGISHVLDCARGKRKTAGGFVWRFKDESKARTD